MEILAFILLAVGALIGYRGGALYKRIKGTHPEEEQLVLLKLAGLLIVIIAVVLIFYIS
ncbi:MAG: hypothetical protein GX957_04160 [Clostridiaceae bacterium]|nr:hypothetical protein [Clostridiaceae bacterium]